MYPVSSGRLSRRFEEAQNFNETKTHVIARDLQIKFLPKDFDWRKIAKKTYDIRIFRTFKIDFKFKGEVRVE